MRAWRIGHACEVPHDVRIPWIREAGMSESSSWRTVYSARCACGTEMKFTDRRYRPRTCEDCKRRRDVEYRARRNDNHVPPSLRAAVIARDGRACRYCSTPVRERRHRHDSGRDTLEIDHVVPVVAGGMTTLANLVVSCFGCNRRKGGRI